jgi:hypothetical protein
MKPRIAIGFIAGLAGLLLSSCEPMKESYSGKSQNAAFLVFAHRLPEEEKLAAEALQKMKWNVTVFRGPTKDEVIAELKVTTYQIFEVNAHSGGDVGINMKRGSTVKPADIDPKSNYMLTIFNSCSIAGGAAKPTWTAFNAKFMKDPTAYQPANPNGLSYGSFAWKTIVDLDVAARWLRHLFENAQQPNMLTSVPIPNAVSKGAAEEAWDQAIADTSITFAPFAVYDFYLQGTIPVINATH